MLGGDLQIMALRRGAIAPQPLVDDVRGKLRFQFAAIVVRLSPSLAERPRLSASDFRGDSRMSTEAVLLRSRAIRSLAVSPKNDWQSR